MGAAFSAVPDQKKANAQSPLVGAIAARIMPIRETRTTIETNEQKEQREKKEKEQEAKLKRLGM